MNDAMNNNEIKSNNNRVKVGHSLTFSFGEYDNTVIVLVGEKYLRHKLGLDCDDKAFNLLCDVQEVESINPIHWRELTESEQRAFSDEMEYHAAADEMEHNHKQDQHDRIMINRVKGDLEDWLTTHGEITMGSEMVEDVHRLIEESVARTKRIREDWMLTDGI